MDEVRRQEKLKVLRGSINQIKARKLPKDQEERLLKATEHWISFYEDVGKDDDRRSKLPRKVKD